MLATININSGAKRNQKSESSEKAKNSYRFSLQYASIIMKLDIFCSVFAQCYFDYMHDKSSVSVRLPFLCVFISYKCLLNLNAEIYSIGLRRKQFAYDSHCVLQSQGILMRSR